VLDASHVISIRRDETSGWRVINGLGVVIKDGFESNAAAWQWVAKHNTDRAVAKAKIDRQPSPSVRP
jgi:hypothetical protein